MILPFLAIAKGNEFESSLASTDRQFPQYLFMHSRGLPFLVSDNRLTLR
jgi:hypothetical protein